MFLTGKDNKMNTPDKRARRTKNDIVYTDPVFGQKMVDYFSPQFKPGDTFVEPCAGQKGIFDALPEPKEYYELAEEKDFLTCDKTYNWCITNFPWSAPPIRLLGKHAYKLCDNVVHIIRLHNILGTYARHHDYLDQGHTIKEIIVMPWKDVFINKSPEGFTLCIFHMQKGWDKGTTWTYWDK